MVTAELASGFLFGDYALEGDRRELRRGSVLLHVQPQVFDLLLYLVTTRDRVSSKDDLIAAVWGGRIVSESTIASRINAVRRAVGDSGEKQRIIRTFVGRGIRFVAAVREHQDFDAAAPIGHDTCRSVGSMRPTTENNHFDACGAQVPPGPVRSSAAVGVVGSYRFGPFVLDLGRGALLAQGGAEIPLRRKSFSLLQLLVENAGHLLTRDTLTTALWPNTFVTDENLTQCVRDVRRALGNASRCLLRTVSGRGYIFEAEAVRQDLQAASQIIGSHTFRASESLSNSGETTCSSGDIGRHRLGGGGSVQLSVLVLPLRSHDGSDAQERLAQSITGDIVTDLNQYLRQFALGDARVLFHDDRLAPTSPCDSQADYVLRGGLRGTHRPSVNLQLLNAASGVCLWAKRCEPDCLHAVIARLMFDVVTVLITDAARRIEALSRSDLTPHELMLRGRALLLLPASPSNRYQARCCFERALAMQPDSVEARLGIVGVLIGHLTSGWSHTAGHDEARAEALLVDAFQAGKEVSVAHGLRGTLRRLQGRLEESRAELELATDRAPHIGMVASQLGMTLLYRGQLEAALPHFEAGVRTGAHDPQRSLLLNNLGTACLLLGDVGRAVELLREAITANPQHSVPALVLAAALGLRSEPVEAGAALQRAIELGPLWGTLSTLRNWVRRQATPELMPIYEHTLERGLQRAGMREV